MSVDQTTSVERELLEAVDARTRLAGSNKMEILLFSLATRETFGINVFKVREVTRTPRITLTPFSPSGVKGVISLRGHIIPVIDLAAFVDPSRDHDTVPGTMMVTEFNRRTQGFLVHGVDRIVRVDWDQVKAPEDMVAGDSGLITGLTRLPDGRLVSILDVEQILAQALGGPVVPELAALDARDGGLLFADDSGIARREIGKVLDKLGVSYQQTRNGAEAFARLTAMADQAQREGAPLKRELKLILTDAEMPEMDGYVLTRKVRSDRRFDGIPVVMHSSLSSDANRSLGKQVGVDAYVAKFDPVVLADTLRPYLVR